jgi:hypothetical protein
MSLVLIEEVHGTRQLNSASVPIVPRAIAYNPPASDLEAVTPTAL